MQVRNTLMLESPVDAVFADCVNVEGRPDPLTVASSNEPSATQELFRWLALVAGENWDTRGHLDVEPDDGQIEWTGAGAPWTHVTISCAGLQGPSTWVVVATELEEPLPGLDMAGSGQLIADLVDQWLTELQALSEERARTFASAR